MQNTTNLRHGEDDFSDESHAGELRIAGSQLVLEVIEPKVRQHIDDGLEQHLKFGVRYLETIPNNHTSDKSSASEGAIKMKQI